MIELLQKLISIPSLSGDESEIGHFLFNHLERLGYKTIRQPVSATTFNILALTEEQPRVLLCTHMDTVAPFLPFKQQDDILFGRGACDAKGQIVAMIKAAEMLRRSNCLKFGLLFVVGEESTSIGAKAASQLDIDSEFVVVGEPTDNKLASGQKGVLMFRLAARGTGGHSSLPEQGESAVHKLLPILQQWITMDWGKSERLGRSLLNVGTINGGVGLNVLAPAAEAEGIFRVATSLSEIHKLMQASLSADVELSILSESEPQHMLTLPGFETQIVGFGTDAGHLRPLGEIVLYGAGSIRFAHANNEQVTQDELQQAAHDYVKIVHLLLDDHSST